MATVVPPPILDRSLQQALLGFAQPLGQGLASGAQNRALQQFALQQGVNIPQGLPPQLTQALIAQTFDPFGQKAAQAGLIGAQTGLAEAQTGQVGVQPERAPTRFEQEQARIKVLSAIPKAQRTPPQQAELDSLVGRKPLTEGQFRVKEGQRIQAIPIDQRTAKEQKRLDDIFAGRPMVQIQLPGEQVKAGREQIGILRDLTTAASEFNAEGIAPNFRAVVKTDVKGRNVIALEPKTKPTSEERNQEVLLTAVRESMANIADVATAKRVGPIQGQFTKIKAELIGSDPSGAELVSELNSLILFVYGLSGKQVNETEFKVLGKLMPQITDPDRTFTARYNTFLRRLKTISGIRNNIWEQIGVAQIQKKRPIVPEAVPDDIRNMTEEQIQAELRGL